MMSALPEAVQRMADEAEQIEQQLRAAQADAAVTSDPAPTQTTAQDSAPATPPAAQEQPDVWQQRYLTLQAKYNAEVPRLSEQLRVVQGEYESIKARLDAKPAEPPKPVVTDEDKNAFGEDLLSMVDRIAAAKTAELAEQLAQRDLKIDELSAKLAQVVGGVSQSDFYSQLDRQMPDWEVTNRDQDFVNRWLNEVDALTGLPRSAILKRHVEANDVEGTLRVFRLYRDSKTAAAPASNPLEKQVAPSRNDSGGATPPAGNEQKVWTQREIAQFYDSVRRKEITPADAARMEAEIMQAAAEGRVR